MPVRVGTDCSGMETPIMALQGLNVDIRHCFSSDINASAKKTIMANYPPDTFYPDLVARNNKQVASVDVYVAGFPCQPFSAAGKQQGFDDEAGRGQVFFGVREYLKLQKPKVFILENVSNILRIEKGETFKAILKSLEQLGCYNVSWKLLNTKEHGVPQNRARVYIVGILKSIDKGFVWPEALPAVDVEEFLDKKPTKVDKAARPPKTSSTAHRNVGIFVKQLIKLGHDPFNEPWIVDIDSSTDRMKGMLRVSPCLTCSRAAGHWVTNRGRRLTLSELKRLQQISPKCKQVVSDLQLGKQIGNAMSVNVLERLFCRILPAAGLVSAKKLHDRWAAKAAKAAKGTKRPAAVIYKTVSGPKDYKVVKAAKAAKAAAKAVQKRAPKRKSTATIVAAKKRKH